MAVVSEVEEIWIKHYSSVHQILLVGEGDFSFSACLASAFGYALNIVATSLDSYEELIKKYKNAKANLAFLKLCGATLLHGVDATTMTLLPDLQMRRFHRIIYNFPHAGFHQKENHPGLIEMHRQLVRGFFSNARSMLLPNGEIHVTHKLKYPYDEWRIVDLASCCPLLLDACVEFHIEDFPGYCHKRGSGSRCDDPFQIGECRTYKFKNIPATWSESDLIHQLSNLNVSICMPAPNFEQPLLYPLTFDNSGMHNEPAPDIYMTEECQRIFGTYLSNVDQTFGSPQSDVHQSVNEALRVGFNTYMSDVPGRPQSGYVSVLQELHSLTVVRLQQLKQMALHLGLQQI